MALYTDLSEALKRARERSASKQADETYLLEILQMSYGVHRITDQIVYRPFYAAAKWLEQSRRDQSITETDKVKFTGQKVPIASLLDLQRALDMELKIKPEFMIFADCSIGDLKSKYDMAVLTLRQFQPRGHG